jgi:zinc transport system substrate-binding protein
MHMKKIIRYMILVAISSFVFVACGKEKDTTTILETQEKYKIVATTFPEYDWVRQILGDQEEQYELTLLLDNGVDLHNYQPTASDMAKIRDCDMFLYVGGESDDWVFDVLDETANKDMIQINLIEVLGDRVKVEELIEGMEAHEHEEEHEEEHEHDEEHEEGEHERGHEHEEHEHEEEVDEHIWLSLRNAEILCAYITEQLGTLDATNKQVYQENMQTYVEKIKVLDQEIADIAENGTQKTVLFGDRFPFRYFFDDYGIEYYAAFAGCSAETEASFETIAFLSEKVNDLSLHGVAVIENSDHEIAETIIANTDAKDQIIYEFQSMQSVGTNDIQKGVTYLSLMEQNKEALKKLLTP